MQSPRIHSRDWIPIANWPLSWLSIAMQVNNNQLFKGNKSSHPQSSHFFNPSLHQKILLIVQKQVPSYSLPFIATTMYKSPLLACPPASSRFLKSIIHTATRAQRIFFKVYSIWYLYSVQNLMVSHNTENKIQVPSFGLWSLTPEQLLNLIAFQSSH